jgi:hypothetical protein
MWSGFRAASTGISSRDPVFLTFPTALPTGQIVNASSEHGLSISSSVAALRRAFFGQSWYAHWLSNRPRRRWLTRKPDMR